MRIILAIVVSIALAPSASDLARPDEFAPERYGVGAMVVQPEDSSYVEIRACTPNGPAARAGLEAGDRILELDGRSIEGWAFDRVIDYLIRSEPLPLRMAVRRGRDVVTTELVRMRIADIEAEAGFRLERTPEGHYRRAPLRPRPQVDVGDIVPLDSLYNAACRPGMLYSSKQNTILYFWTGWCAPCKTLFKEIDGNWPPHRRVAVSLDASCEDFQAAIKTHDPPGEEFWAGGWYGTLSQALGIYRRGVPTAAMLDPEGRFLRVATGTDAIMKMLHTEPPAAWTAMFVGAAREFGVPVDVLIAVGYCTTVFNHDPEPSPTTGDCGVMALQSRGDSAPLTVASELVGLPADSLCSSVEANIRGGAALLAHEFVAVHGPENTAEKMRIVENWRRVLPRYTRYQNQDVDDVSFRRFNECLAARGF